MLSGSAMSSATIRTDSTAQNITSGSGKYSSEDIKELMRSQTEQKGKNTPKKETAQQGEVSQDKLNKIFEQDKD